MAKRTRGVTPTSAYRPGQAPVRKSAPSTKPATATTPPTPAPGAIDSAIAQTSVAATTGQTVQATTSAAVAAPTSAERAPVASHQRGHVKVKPNSLLAARAAQEYVYVGEDLRHIAKVALGMLVVMIVLYLIVVTANVFGIY